MQVSQAANTQSDIVGTMREGVLAQKHLLLGRDGAPDNFDLNMGRTGQGGWRAPRHRHDFDQIRYVLKGQYPLDEKRTLPQGWVAYFPESVPYGPQDRPEGLETVVLQFGGASGNGYLSVAGREAANEALKKKGEFKKGKFIYKDERGVQHEVDGSEACFEEATGRKLAFAPPRYEDVVIMDPSAYTWMPTGTEGVSVKWLVSFAERGARIGFVRVDQGAAYGGGQHPSIEILFQTAGKVALNGQEYGPESAFEFEPNEGPIALRAVEPTEFLCMVLHKF